jgi:hypothetical protein
MRDRVAGSRPRIAAQSGHFSAMPRKSEPDLFGSLDMLYAAHIIGKIDDVVDAAGRRAWIEHILSYQDEDGWFRSRDRQVHGVEHATSYAIGGLQILAGGDGTFLRDQLKPFAAFQSEISARPSQESPPFSLTLLHRLHFWRGSHRAAGLAAIIGAVQELGLPSNEFLGISSSQAWLQGWWSYFEPHIDPSTGYWALAPRRLQVAFNALYKFRHSPRLASMGAAVHLYWISEKIGVPILHPVALISATIGIMRPSGLYEEEPYCIDLDANFLIARSLAQLDPDHPLQEAARLSLRKNRDAILDWFSSRPPRYWNQNSHKIPGAFAAVAEADRALLSPADRQWRDVFKTTWWL